MEQISKIESSRKEALEKLNMKYALADKVKTSFGYIGIIINILTWGCFILNDLIKLLHLCYKETKELLKERRERNENKKMKDQKTVTIQLEKEQDEMRYSQDLEEKLDKIHLQLVRACAARRFEMKRKNSEA